MPASNLIEHKTRTHNQHHRHYTLPRLVQGCGADSVGGGGGGEDGGGRHLLQLRARPRRGGRGGGGQLRGAAPRRVLRRRGLVRQDLARQHLRHDRWARHTCILGLLGHVEPSAWDHGMTDTGQGHVAGGGDTWHVWAAACRDSSFYPDWAVTTGRLIPASSATDTNTISLLGTGDWGFKTASWQWNKWPIWPLASKQHSTEWFY